MKSLIIGGTSGLGCALKPVLLRRGPVVTAGRYNCDFFLDVRHDIDISDWPTDIDVVIHTAAHFGGMTDDTFLKAVETNVAGTLRVCDIANALAVKHVIYISSIHATFDTGGRHHTAYSLTKRQGEEVAALSSRQNHIPLTILRPSPLYGPESFRRHQPFFYDIIDHAQSNTDVVLWGGHDPLRNYLHVDDLAETIAKVATLGIDGIYSCQHIDNVTYSQIAKTAFRIFGSSARVEFVSDKPDIPDSIFPLDVDLYDRIARYPEINLEKGIAMIAKQRTIK